MKEFLRYNDKIRQCQKSYDNKSKRSQRVWGHGCVFFYFIFKNGQIPASFCLFSLFSLSNSKWQIYTWNYINWAYYAWDSNPRPQMVGADDSTELWRLPSVFCFLPLIFAIVTYISTHWLSLTVICLIRLVYWKHFFISRNRLKPICLLN